MQNEFGLIDKIKKIFSPLVPENFEGIGDDCAVIPIGEGESLVVSTDMLVEGVHFLRDRISASELGAKALSVNLSDIAAMGATPVASFLSLGLPAGVESEWTDAFMSGYHSVSERFATPLLGGDTTASPGGIVLNVAVIGRVDDICIKRRSGARVGQKISVTGFLGDSGAGLKLLLDGVGTHQLIDIHNNPTAQVAIGKVLGKDSRVGAMMDISDGVASDLGHILRASGVGAVVELDRVPVSPLMREVCAERGWDATELAMCGGEDYQLLFTADADGCEGYHVIGEIIEGEPHIEWQIKGKRTAVDYRGFSHKL